MFMVVPLEPASSWKEFRAPRAMPSVWPASGVKVTAMAERNWHRGAWSKGWSTRAKVRLSGTNSSETATSLLPVPCRPITDQLSTTPCVLSGDRHHPELRESVERAAHVQARAPLVGHDAVEGEPVGVLAAAGEVPLPGDHVTAIRDRCRTQGAEGTGAPEGGRSSEQLPGHRSFQPPREQAEGPSYESTPAHGAIRHCQFFDYLEGGDRVDLGTAQRAWHVGTEKAGAVHGGNQGRRQAALPVHFVARRDNLRAQGPGCRNHVVSGRRGHFCAPL